MTFEVFESSARQGRPVELFEFTQGSQVWRYTAYDQDYSWDGETWTAETIRRGRIRQSGKADQAGVDLKFPRTNSLAAAFLTGLMEQITSLTVWRGHVGDPDEEFVVSWKGRVVGAEGDGPEINLSCESIFTSLRRQGLRRRWQRNCPHALYGRGCNLDKAAFAEGPFIPTAVNGLSVTVPDAALQPNGWYTGGMLEAENSYRFILAHEGDQVVLSRPFIALADAIAGAGWGKSWGKWWGGPGVVLYPGCDRTEATCNSKYANGLNFGGWRYIPQKNPMGGSSIV
jgi:uncharacterized phage protein (TIGR02218 family)